MHPLVYTDPRWAKERAHAEAIREDRLRFPSPFEKMLMDSYREAIRRSMNNVPWFANG